MLCTFNLVTCIQNTHITEIANTLGENLEKSSSSSNCNETFQNNKNEKERLNFQSQVHETYNLLFSSAPLSKWLWCAQRMVVSVIHRAVLDSEC